MRRQSAGPTQRGSFLANHPLRWGFIVTIGALLAVLLALTVFNLQGVLLSVFIAGFIALGLDPLIRWFQRRGMRRVSAIITVILLFVGAVIGVMILIVPVLIEQASSLVTTVPQQLQGLFASDWFANADAATNGLLTGVATSVGDILSDPNLWATVGGGALKVGASIIGAISTGFFVFVLSIYFIATLDSSKQAIYTMVRASHRDSVESYSERIMDSIGKYLSGMFVLAFMNATYSTILLILVGVPYALIIGVVALFITLIPLIGTVLTTFLMTIIAFFVSPTAGVVVLIAMLVYMQVEAYVLTPKIMGKAVQVPGTIVLISALAGGTLLGLLGALVAIPISAGILLIIREIYVPRQAKL